MWARWALAAARAGHDLGQSKEERMGREAGWVVLGRWASLHACAVEGEGRPGWADAGSWAASALCREGKEGGGPTLRVGLAGREKNGEKRRDSAQKNRKGFPIFD